MKVIDKLSTYASLIGVVGAIGGGFYAWGEFNTRLDVLENKDFVVNETVNLDPINEKISELEVDIIDRIKKVDDKIIVTDLSSVQEDITELKNRKVNLKPLNDAIKELENKVAELKQEVAIVAKENELQDVLIEEVKKSTSNPLGG
tara:strand:+ start:362 stop:799 length:438 start_codon:yes stop_codon:yes gene_type:complete